MTPRVYPPKRTLIALRLDPAVLARVDAAAAQAGVRRSAMLRQMLEYAEARMPQGTPRRVWTASDPEPPIGTRVKDDLGRVWRRSTTAHGDSTYWVQPGNEDADPESWTKVAGNYGPVVVSPFPYVTPSPETTKAAPSPK